MEEGNKQYRIGELAKMAKVTVRAIRYYEEVGLFQNSSREEAKHRRYVQEDFIHLLRIQQLKSYGLSLKEIKEIFDLFKEDPTGEKSRLKLISRYKKKHSEAVLQKKEIELHIADLKWHIEQLQNVENFQACPGDECLLCQYSDKCKFIAKYSMFYSGKE